MNHWMSIPARSTGIWPGDTNADGVVDVFDVEPIAFGFGHYGPPRMNRSIQWMEIDATLWDIPEFVHADATGDGVINQNDLLPVGFNFGKSIPSNVAKEHADMPLVRRPESVDLPLPPMRAGETLELPLYADPSFSAVADLRSFAFRLNVDASLIQVESVLPAAGFDVPGTLRMIKSEPEFNRYSAAFSRTIDMGTITVDGPLALISLRALTDLPMDAALTIDRSMTGIGDARSLPARFFTPFGAVTSITPDVVIPLTTRLDANYPNPFNPTTTIRYHLSAAGQTRVAVYDVLGREVAVLVDTALPAGSYQTVFDASGLSSGVYLLRMTVDSETYTQRMTMVK
jgi:hypothetical protein